MLLSYNWIKQFTSLSNITPDTLANRLTLHSVEVEGMIELGANLDHIVVGRVESVQKHPNADTLNVCMVSIGDTDPIQIVCGGSNVKEGMLCALGMIGARVQWHGEGELIKLKKTNIRGEESLGMICASDEIGLGSMFPKSEEKEILDLSHLDVPVGTPLKDALGLDDVLIDVENKTMTHRPDLWGHYGMAREIAAIFGIALSEYRAAPIAEEPKKNLAVTIDTDQCHRYMGVLIDGVQIAESPEWIKKRLLAVGVTPKNNIVDITNYVMIELGQPMHAFDAMHLQREETRNKSQDTTIVVRQAIAEETFTALGGKEYILTTEDMVITCDEKVIALAGVKGDEYSGVTDTTTSILLEAATFDPTSVRRTATRHGLRTDASARFEKSLDTNLAELALRRAVELVLQLCSQARVVSTVADVTAKATTEAIIDLDLSYLRSRIGVALSVEDVTRTLERLGFSVKEKKDMLHVTVPTWRATKDVSIQEDLIEEVARMYGYNTVPVALPTANIAPPAIDAYRDMEKRLTDILATELGYTEVYNYSFVSPEYLGLLGISTEDHLELDNPVAKDRPYLRQYLLPNLLQHVESNLHRFDEVSLFEIGRVYHSGAGEDMDALQTTKCAILFAAKGEETPFFELRHVLDRIADRVGLSMSLTQMHELPAPWNSIVHPGRAAGIRVAGTDVGTLTELNPALGERLGIPYRVAVLELNVGMLAELAAERVAYEPIPVYPSVSRDVSFLVDTTVRHADLVSTVQAVDPQIRSIALLDVYTGDHVPARKKSMTYRVTYRSDEGTLASVEVDALHARVLEQLDERHAAEIR